PRTRVSSNRKGVSNGNPRYQRSRTRNAPARIGSDTAWVRLSRPTGSVFLNTTGFVMFFSSTCCASASADQSCIPGLLMQTLRHQARHSSCTFSPPRGGRKNLGISKQFTVLLNWSGAVWEPGATRRAAAEWVFFFSRHGPTSCAPSPEAVVPRPCDQQAPCRCSQHNGDADSTATRAPQNQPLIAELPLMSVLPTQCTLDMTVAIPGHGHPTGAS